MDRPVAVANAETIGGRDRGANPVLGIADGGYHVLALGEAGGDRRRQRAARAMGIFRPNARRGQREGRVSVDQIVDALRPLPVPALDQYRPASKRQQPPALDAGDARVGDAPEQVVVAGEVVPDLSAHGREPLEQLLREDRRRAQRQEADEGAHLDPTAAVDMLAQLAGNGTALELGVATFDCAVAGLGGCPYAKGATGNVASEDVVYLLQGLGIETGVDMTALRRAGQYISDFLQRPPVSRVARALNARSPLAA